MSGPYCRFCDHRCFVYREIIVGGKVVWWGYMATCVEGARHSRSTLGQDYTNAHNPYFINGISEAEART